MKIDLTLSFARPDPIFRYLSVDLNTGVLGFLALLLVLLIKIVQ